ncbi:MAG: FAD-binding protein, partial [Candidatus Eremiobacteraeota bacterium]|nr:FAD-binding protein [Candidatus Eremiobacteraeota bacterium]
IDPRTQLIPVAPAAHYHMGGIAVDRWGRTSLPGLWACGEASATGIHGANRLASNSLLEAVVYGSRVAEDVKRQKQSVPPHIAQEHARPPIATRPEGQMVASLRKLMFDNVGVTRDARDLEAGLDAIAQLEHSAVETRTRNLLTIARLIASAALARKESRGSHYRSDFPAADPTLAKRSFIRLSPDRTQLEISSIA